MTAPSRRGGARPGAGRKPLPAAACASVWDLPVARACYEGDRKGCAER